jgi:hypothetical protein
MPRARVGRSALGGKRVVQAAREIHELLLKQRPAIGPRVGLDLPMNDAQLALIAQKAVDLFPDLTVIKGKDRMMLCFREGLAQGASEELTDTLEKSGFVGRKVTTEILDAGSEDGKDPDVA